MNLPHLVLGGIMGAGKTTIGRLLATRAGVPFVDLDAAVLDVAATEGHAVSTVAALFAELGEPTFRRLEAEALTRALAASSPTVIATGGGALVDPASRRRALTSARVVTLTAPPATLLARLTAPDQPRRPLLEADPEAALRALLADRSPAYAEAHATIATDAAPDDVAGAVLRAWRSPSVLVPLGERSYPVRFTGDAEAGTLLADVLDVLRPTRWLLVTDTTVDTQWGAPLAGALTSRGSPHVPAATVRLTPGERHKTLAAVEHILHTALEAGLDRGSVIVAHGGGVAGDMAGFAAAIFLRGVRWISVPTTLLSMADAAIGGKTGIDLGLAKNAVGAFHQPSAVIIDPRRTLTEAPRAFTGGLAEIVKSAAIADPVLLTHLERHVEILRAPPSPPLTVLETALAAATSIKASIVAADERETGLRALLNFGHTLGHALEASGGFERWTHGEAVSLGMVAALRAGVALHLTPPTAAQRIITLLTSVGLPTRLPLSEIEAALPFLTLDKKRSGASVRAIFLTDIGRAVAHPLPLSTLATLYRAAAD